MNGQDFVKYEYSDWKKKRHHDAYGNGDSLPTGSQDSESVLRLQSLRFYKELYGNLSRNYFSLVCK